MPCGAPITLHRCRLASGHSAGDLHGSGFRGPPRHRRCCVRQPGDDERRPLDKDAAQCRETAKAADTSTVAAGADNGAASTGSSLYRPSPIKRQRRNNDELADLDDVIMRVIAADNPVTLRGVYYRVVSEGAVEKTEAGYKLVGRQLVKLRRAGGVSYDSITDGTRWITRPTTHSSVEDMLNDVTASYRRMIWATQDVEVHVFTEKDAISGVILPVTHKWDVPLAVVRGYCSESFAYALGLEVAAAGKPVIIYQLGDHDPSGLDAWRDLRKKVARFAPDADVTFERLAVTRE